MKQLSYERRIQLLALAAGFPGSLIALILLWTGNFTSGAFWTLAFLIVVLWMGFAFSLRSRVVFSLQTLSNLLAALRDRKIMGAGLDVFHQEPLAADDPILALPNVVVSPHNAGQTPEVIRDGLIAAVANIENYLQGKPSNLVVSPGR